MRPDQCASSGRTPSSRAERVKTQGRAVRLAATFASAIVNADRLAAGHSRVLSGQARAADYYPPRAAWLDRTPGLRRRRERAAGLQLAASDGSPALHGGRVQRQVPRQLDLSQQRDVRAPPVSLPLPVSLAPNHLRRPLGFARRLRRFIGCRLAVGRRGRRPGSATSSNVAGLKGTATTAFDQRSSAGNIAYRVAGTATNQFKMDNDAVLKLARRRSDGPVDALRHGAASPSATPPRTPARRHDDHLGGRPATSTPASPSTA